MLSKLLNIRAHKTSGIVGLNERNLKLIYPNNPREYYVLADDKVLTKEVLQMSNIPCAQTYEVIRSNSEIKRKWKNCSMYDKIAIKPAKGSGGGGIMILKKNENDKWISGGRVVEEREIFQHMAAIIMGFFSLGSDDKVLIEECIEPHPFFHEIYPEGVPDFRVILLNHVPIMSMLRMPTDRSDGKANLHQEGIGIGVDIEKGTLSEVYDGHRYYNCHPDSKAIVSGVVIPYWDKILEISIATAKAFPHKYLGVDIVIDKDKGPQIMEINVRPGLAIQLVNKKGLKKAGTSYNN